MSPRFVWAHLASNKRLVSPSLCLTFMSHVIFVKKQSKGRWALRVGGLASLAKKGLSLPSLLLTHLWYVFLGKKAVPKDKSIRFT